MNDVRLQDLEHCFGGAIPAMLTTAAADGTPNVMYLSRAHQVDDERVALSNQFMSKTSRNLSVNPLADLLLVDPHTHDEFRLLLRYERTDRRGHVFDRLRADIESLAAMVGMQDVFRLRAADIFRVLDIEQVPHKVASATAGFHSVVRSSPELANVAELAQRLSRAPDLETLVDTALVTLDELFGYRHTMVLLLDESGRNLYTLASRGFDAENVGAEVPIGEGQIGVAAQRCEVSIVGGIAQLQKYSRSVRREYEGSGVPFRREIPMPGLDSPQSRVVVPAMALGELIGVLVAESERMAAFDGVDAQMLSVAASLVANAIATAPDVDRDVDEVAPAPAAVAASPGPAAGSVVVRYFASDASVFFDGDYLIKGVAGRILWSLLSQYVASGRTEFTNRELRLDPTLELPGFKDNLESRLLLLKRRLDERDAPVRIEKTSRGRFRLDVTADLHLDPGV